VNFHPVFYLILVWFLANTLHFYKQIFAKQIHQNCTNTNLCTENSANLKCQLCLESHNDPELFIYSVLQLSIYIILNCDPLVNEKLFTILLSPSFSPSFFRMGKSCGVRLVESNSRQT